MAEDLCSFSKDTFIIKLPKASPLILRMTLLVIATVCGVYICSICLKQISSQTMSSIEVIGSPCCNLRSKNLEDRYLHYPRPESFNRAECAGNPVRFFVIISLQRSGSGWFETLLNSHINVSSNGEIFSIKDRRDNISSIIKTLDRVYNLDWLSSASKNECSAAVGLKWMLNQSDAVIMSEMGRFSFMYDLYMGCPNGIAATINRRLAGLMGYPEEIAEYFNRRGVSAIFLFRRNLLRRMVSVLANSFDRYAKLLNGTHKSHVHSPEEAETLSKYKPFINSTSLISDLQEAELKMSQALASFNKTRHIIVYYEELIKNRTKLVDIQDFLGIPRMPLTSRQVKIHRGPLWEHIKNWDDVNKTLDGTAYERFLHADY